MSKEYYGYLVSACEPGCRFTPEVRNQLKSTLPPAYSQVALERENSQRIEIPAPESFEPQQSVQCNWIDFWIDGIDF